MPIPVGTIMISRLLGVYLMGLMYSGVVLIPAAAVYLIIASHSLPAVIGCILLVLLISVFVLTVSSALGWVVAKISLKLKNKSFITVIVSLLFFGAYYFVCFKAQDIISDLIVNAAKYGDKIKGDVYKRQQYDYKFVCVSHNTLRGAAGGAVLLAELLCAKGYMD